MEQVEFQKGLKQITDADFYKEFLTEEDFTHEQKLIVARRFIEGFQGLLDKLEAEGKLEKKEPKEGNENE